MIKREYIKYDDKDINRSLRFLYLNPVGRVVLKAAVCPFITKTAGIYMDSRLSKWMIKPAVRRNNIDLDDFINEKYHSYNDYFTRKIRPELRPVDTNPDHLISPCDAKLSAYDIGDNCSFRIKKSNYTLDELLHDKELAQEFNGGVCLIFRLDANDYHRYCYFDNGQEEKNCFIKGKFHTVRSISSPKYNIYKSNCREYTVIDTDHFGKAVAVEVGAMMIGRICNYHEKKFTRGEEKGMFEFGGSTIVLLLKGDCVRIDSDIIKATENHMETVVRMGEKIGERIYDKKNQGNINKQ